jgi:enoyl-CoA hydratase
MAISDQYLDVRSRNTSQITARELHLDRPEKYNALPHESINTLIEWFGTIGDDIGAIVITGAGEHFCVGADIQGLSPPNLQDNPASPACRVQKLVSTMRSCDVPIVTAVHGKALGVGCHLCVGSDIVIATNDAMVGMPEIKLDLPVAGFVVPLLAAQVGEKRARDWLLTGRTVPAEEAENAGLVSRSIPNTELESTIREYLNALGRNGSLSIRLLRKRFNRLIPPEMEELANEERESFRMALEEGTAEERIQSFSSNQ